MEPKRPGGAGEPDPGEASTVSGAGEEVVLVVGGAPFDEAGDRYRRGEQLGRGGLGEVLLTRDRRIGRDVAMKVLRSDVSGSQEIAARFLREARLQGILEHPAVVPVYDLGR